MAMPLLLQCATSMLLPPGAVKGAQPQPNFMHGHAPHFSFCGHAVSYDGHSRARVTMEASADESAAAMAGGSPEAAPDASPGAAVVATPPLGPDGKPDLSAMSFDERLEYLASTADMTVAPEPEDETSLFGFDASNAEMVFWSPKFLGLCFQDLREMSWPTPKTVAQTVVTSQIAFIAIAIFILVFDALAEATIRSVVQGSDFVVRFDGSASPSRGM